MLLLHLPSSPSPTAITATASRLQQTPAPSDLARSCCRWNPTTDPLSPSSSTESDHRSYAIPPQSPSSFFFSTELDADLLCSRQPPSDPHANRHHDLPLFSASPFILTSCLTNVGPQSPLRQLSTTLPLSKPMPSSSTKSPCLTTTLFHSISPTKPSPTSSMILTGAPRLPPLMHSRDPICPDPPPPHLLRPLPIDDIDRPRLRHSLLPLRSPSAPPSKPSSRPLSPSTSADVCCPPLLSSPSTSSLDYTSTRR